MYHLQMTNWHWTPIIDPSCHKRTLYPLNPIIKIHQIGHSSDSGQNFQKKKKVPRENVFLHLCVNLWPKNPNSLCYRCVSIFDIFILCQFCHRSVDRKNCQKLFLGSLMYHLQMTNWHWTPIIDPSCHKRTLYPLNPIIKIHQIGHSSDSGQNFQKKKKVPRENVFLHLCVNLWPKNPNSLCYRPISILTLSKKFPLYINFTIEASIEKIVKKYF